ncbi:hypothetical protein DFH08DRAFT_1085674 [Mycena albidolilacea]|uniref:Uncharacterized protein n=1 Tax=Mycena albidolilacea TaxID=1033008 RepID=A0AAD6ZI93_9AGAR|nr:hypothetical protein DFH08DRAFT_1085674 [Mycena albidolilacea]
MRRAHLQAALMERWVTVERADVTPPFSTSHSLLSTFYSEDLKEFSQADFEYDRFSPVAEHEAAHTLYPVALSQVIEGVGTSAYTGAAKYITSKPYLMIAASPRPSSRAAPPKTPPSLSRRSPTLTVTTAPYFSGISILSEYMPAASHPVVVPEDLHGQVYAVLITSDSEVDGTNTIAWPAILVSELDLGGKLIM